MALVARLDEERLEALTGRIDADLAVGQAPDVVAELEDLTRAKPLREQLRAAQGSSGQLRRALAATGRTAEALAGYERLRGILADSLFPSPSAWIIRSGEVVTRSSGVPLARRSHAAGTG